MCDTKVFGPVPSRRLGRSIGINNIPHKTCSYSCVYCQIGIAPRKVVERRSFHDPVVLLENVQDKIRKAEDRNETIDYLTFVPDGEPTLDRNLGKLIDLLKPLGFKIAVITNSSRLDDHEVREELGKADWVSMKIDTLDERVWKKMDRPHKTLDFESMLNGMLSFSRAFEGMLVTETMLVKDLNDEVTKVAEFIKKIDPATAYLGVPTRPPAKEWVEAPDEQTLNEAFQVFVKNGITTEYLIGYEGNEFAYTGNVKEDLLSITSVHPMREDAVKRYLKKADGDFSIIEELLNENELVLSEYNDNRYYVRKFKGK